MQWNLIWKKTNIYLQIYKHLQPGFFSVCAVESHLAKYCVWMCIDLPWQGQTLARADFGSLQQLAGNHAGNQVRRRNAGRCSLHISQNKVFLTMQSRHACQAVKWKVHVCQP